MSIAEMSRLVPSNTGAVIFDLDGTLYTLSAIGFHIAVGLPFSAGPLRNLFPVRDEMRGIDYKDLPQFKKVFAEKLGARCRMRPEAALTWYEEKFMPRFIRVLEKRGKVRAGLPGLLLSLNQKGIRLGVVSDFGRVNDRLQALGIDPKLFDAVHGAEEFGVMKPSAKPFSCMLEHWGIPAERTVLVGDRADHDLGSARLLGASFLGIENNKSGAFFFPWPNVVKALSDI